MVEASPVPSCASCGQPLAGRYCAACGEESLDPHKLTVRYFLAHSLIPELVNFDGKIWRTLRYLLFRPALLSLEYAAGRRRAYVQPVRVLLVSIIVYVLSAQGGSSLTLDVGFGKMNVAPAGMPSGRSVEGTLFNIDRFGILERMYTAKLGPPEEASDDVRRRFNDMLGNFVTPLSFTSVVLFAAALYLVFRRRRPLFVEHAVFSIHYFSFVLLSTMVVLIVIRLRLFDFPVILALMFFVFGWQAVYLAVGLRRFYRPNDRGVVAPWAKAVSATVFLYVLNMMFITAVQLAGGALAIWRL